MAGVSADEPGPARRAAATPAASTGGASRGRVGVHIDRLIIDGLAGRTAEAVATAFVAELRRLAEAGAPPMGDIGAELEVDPERDPVAAGRLVAAAVHSRLLGSGHG